MFFKFTEERTAAVREAAATAFAALILKFEGDPKQKELINKIRREYRAGTFKKRQLYIIMSASIMSAPQLKQIWCDYFKEDTLSLADDETPNVRIALARILKQHYKLHGHFMDDRQVKYVVAQLNTDDCEDVRHIVFTVAGDTVQDSSSELSSQISKQEETRTEPENASENHQSHYTAANVSEEQDKSQDEEVDVEKLLQE